MQKERLVSVTDPIVHWGSLSTLAQNTLLPCSLGDRRVERRRSPRVDESNDLFFFSAIVIRSIDRSIDRQHTAAPHRSRRTFTRRAKIDVNWPQSGTLDCGAAAKQAMMPVDTVSTPAAAAAAN